MAKKAGRGPFYYDFEEPVRELDEKIEELQQQLDEENGEQLREKISALEQERDAALSQIMSDLTPYQRVQLARHPQRPQSRDYIPLLFDDFIELHGDRGFGDDHAIITGFATIENRRLMLIAQHKGRDTQEKMKSNFGMPQPEGYRKALAKMSQAEKFGLPVLSLIDTPGAAPAVEAEERGQGMAIAENIYRMAGLKTPIIIVVTGEGCSGGALGVGVGDRHGMLQNAYYSVISPEGCAAILFRESEKAEDAARALKLTANDMLGFGVVDEIIEEPIGGAHRDKNATAENIRRYIIKTLDELGNLAIEDVLEQRYERYRKLGVYTTAGS
ncbi:MAG: acetyl-CoA carboxylase carboxyltransferase subunit alpha [Planctomycetes bacterium]|nr:acetyl-CoA carboxylase carboxyltransferase subunit alpha [Planctomycetota bacterium]